MMPQQASQKSGAAGSQRQHGNPGAEFLERRYQQAARVPASERSPDVAAFVEAYQLLQQALAMLPIDHNRRPTLPDTPASRQNVLSAFCSRCAPTWSARSTCSGWCPHKHACTLMLTG
jgi:hypothetical protein